MNIGPLNTRGRFESRSVTQDAAFGTEVVTWALAAVRWCNVQDVLPSRSEGIVRDLEVSKNPTRLRIRYCTDITSKMRLIINRPTRTIYQLVSGPAIIGDKDGLEFMIEKVSTDV